MQNVQTKEERIRDFVKKTISRVSADGTKGCVTQEKYLIGRSLYDIENILGFHFSRLSEGAVVVALGEKPKPHDFEFAGYTQVASHRFEKEYGNMPLTKPAVGESQTDFNLRINKIKMNIINNVWTLNSTDRLVKIIPVIPHQDKSILTDEEQYPPGSGVPQWYIKNPIKAEVVGVVLNYPNGVYRPSASAIHYF
jgi:hypothetical protein